jgi:hypothetical protein
VITFKISAARHQQDSLQNVAIIAVDRLRSAHAQCAALAEDFWHHDACILQLRRSVDLVEMPRSTAGKAAGPAEATPAKRPAGIQQLGDDLLRRVLLLLPQGQR